MPAPKTDKLLSKADLWALPADNHHDGRGLYLAVTAAGGRSWIYRYRFGQKIRHMGLGSLEKVTLAEARAEHRRWLPVLWAKLDPIAERDRAEQEKRVAGITFKAVALEWLAVNEPGWRSAKHRRQARNTLATYAYPVIGNIPVAALTRSDVLSVLQPHWLTINETMVRLKGRILSVLNFAVAKEYMDETPVRDDVLKEALPGSKRRVQHHPAIPFADLPAFMAALRQRRGIAARALEFTILCASRTTEARKAERTEFDLDAAIWTIPAGRIKGEREHRVPLSPRAVAIVRELMGLHAKYIFSARKRKPLSECAMLDLLGRMGLGRYTVHGMRSTFRDWAGERTSFPREICELALAHVNDDATEAAYLRSDFFEKRRALMETWARFAADDGAPIRLVGVAE